MNAAELAKPDNGADRTITLQISGNRLVSVLNTVDALLHETGRYRFQGNDVVASSDWYQQLRNVTEAMRDELSRQRCEGQVFYAPEYPEALVRQVATDNARRVIAKD